MEQHKIRKKTTKRTLILLIAVVLILIFAITQGLRSLGIMRYPRFAVTASFSYYEQAEKLCAYLASLSEEYQETIIVIEQTTIPFHEPNNGSYSLRLGAMIAATYIEVTDDEMDKVIRDMFRKHGIDYIAFHKDGYLWLEWPAPIQGLLRTFDGNPPKGDMLKRWSHLQGDWYYYEEYTYEEYESFPG